MNECECFCSPIRWLLPFECEFNCVCAQAAHFSVWFSLNHPRIDFNIPHDFHHCWRWSKIKMFCVCPWHYNGKIVYLIWKLLVLMSKNLLVLLLTHEISTTNSLFWSSQWPDVLAKRQFYIVFSINFGHTFSLGGKFVFVSIHSNAIMKCWNFLYRLIEAILIVREQDTEKHLDVHNIDVIDVSSGIS